MKKLALFILSFVLCTTLFAQVKVNHIHHQAVSVKMEQPALFTGVEKNMDIIPTHRNSPMAPSNQLYNLVGETRYNITTNCNARNTIGFNPKSLNGAAVWIMGTNSGNRGTGINYYDANVNEWGVIPDPESGRIETVATGWGTHGFTQGGEVVAAHNSATGLTVNTRNVQGVGNWQQSTLVGPQYKVCETSPTCTNPITTTSLLWPSMATNGNTVHLLCVTAQWPSGTNFPANFEPNPNQPPYGYLGFPTFPLYYRSKDGGKTWEAPKDLREFGMTNYECFTVNADSYSVAVRGNHVVILYLYKLGFCNYMESKDGGDSWVKKTVYDNGMVFSQIEQMVEPRLMPTSGTIYIDENHKVHVVFSTQCYYKNAGTTTINYFPRIPIGMVYWNDMQAPIDWQNIRAWVNDGSLVASNWEEYPGYIEVPSVLGLDKFYYWSEFPQFNIDQFRGLGWSIYPKILAKDGRVYVSYQAPLEYPLIDDGNFNLYRGIFITVSEDYGQSWDVKNNTSWISYGNSYGQVLVDWSNYSGPQYEPGTGDPFWNGWIDPMFLNENAHPSMSYNYKGDLFMLQWTNQYESFLAPAGYQSTPIDIIAFTQDLKNIPAYKNLQEVYKGWWNGTEPQVQFPPQACEKPSEFTAVCVNNDVVLHWEEP